MAAIADQGGVWDYASSTGGGRGLLRCFSQLLSFSLQVVESATSIVIKGGVLLVVDWKPFTRVLLDDPWKEERRQPPNSGHKTLTSSGCFSIVRKKHR